MALHRLVYAAAICAVVHFFWLVKADQREPLVYGAILAGLLAARVVPALRRARLKPAPQPGKIQATSLD